MNVSVLKRLHWRLATARHALIKGSLKLLKLTFSPLWEDTPYVSHRGIYRPKGNGFGDVLALNGSQSFAISYCLKLGVVFKGTTRFYKRGNLKACALTTGRAASLNVCKMCENTASSSLRLKDIRKFDIQAGYSD